MASAMDGGADASKSGSCSGRADAGDDDSAVSFPELPAPVSGGGGGDFAVWGEDEAERREIDASELEMMKERFAKLLLGEDMSGGSKGVSTALAIANAITNLSATIFGALWRLEPLAPQKKSMWRREMECLLCVTDYIVDLVPSRQAFPGGGTFDVMVPRPRSDLYMNLPALKKLDAMLIGVLDSFQETEFSYVDRGILLADSEETGSFPLSSSQGQPSTRQEDKWWLPCPHVPPNGLSDETRKRLQQCRDCVNQIMKAAIAINSGVLAEMEIPDGYYRSLHKKCGKACLGDTIYHYISAEKFSPECILDCLDISSEYQALEIANRIEGAINLWNQKFYKKHPNRKKTQKPSWTGKVKGLVGDAEKSHKVVHRAECLLQSLKIRYPALPQSLLDMTKIQYNKDVGQSILESYSRVMESLAFNIMARIDDVIYVDDAIRDCAAEPVSVFTRGGFCGLPLQKKMPPSPFSIQKSSYSPPFASSEFSSSSAVGSPKKPQLLDEGKLMVQKNEKMEKQVSTEKERVWSYAESLTTGRDAGVTPERH